MSPPIFGRLLVMRPCRVVGVEFPVENGTHYLGRLTSTSASMDQNIKGARPNVPDFVSCPAVVWFASVVGVVRRRCARTLALVVSHESLGCCSATWLPPWFRSVGVLPFVALSVVGCMPESSPPPVTAIPTKAATCEALRPDMPIRYSGKSDTPETVRQVRAVNARFAAACS